MSWFGVIRWSRKSFPAAGFPESGEVLIKVCRRVIQPAATCSIPQMVAEDPPAGTRVGIFGQRSQKYDAFIMSGWGYDYELSKNYVDKVEYVKAGTTASGAPYYNATGGKYGTGTYYVCWDPDLYGGTETRLGPRSGRAPSLTAENDLNGNGFVPAGTAGSHGGTQPLGYFRIKDDF